MLRSRRGPGPRVLGGKEKRTRSMEGVTLIELMITLSVAAILLSLAIPSFQQIAATNRVAGLTNELTAALNLARSEAIKRGDDRDPLPLRDTGTVINNTRIGTQPRPNRRPRLR